MAFGAKIKLTVDTSNSAAFRQQVQKLVDSATKDTPISLRKFNVQISNTKSITSALQSQINSAVGDGLVIKVNSFDTTGAVRKLRADLETMMRGLTINNMSASFKSGDLTSGLNAVVTVNKSAEKAAADATAAIAKEKAALQELNNIKSILNSSYKSSQKLGDAESIIASQDEYRQLIELEERYRANVSNCSEEEIADLARKSTLYKQNIDSLIQMGKVQAKITAASMQSAESELAKETQVLNLRNQINRYIHSNTRAYKAYSDQFDGMMYKLKFPDAVYKGSLESIRAEFLKVKDAAVSTGNVGLTAIERLKKGWTKFGGWAIVTASLTKVSSTIKDMVSAVTDLDTAMTELRKVTDLSDRAYAEYMTSATATAKEIGVTVSDTINATADYSRLGYDIDMSSEMAKAALVYKNVGDGIDDISIATESLISTIKAFGDGTYDAMEIVDKFNEVGNNFAISSAGIGEALKKSAASLAAGGNTLEESIGMIVAMNNVLQNTDSVGTTLKTVSMYLRAAKTEAEAAGESTDGMASSVSKLREDILTLTKNKVDIMIDENTFKSTYQIIKELSAVIGSMADVDKAALYELLGGKRNSNAVAALMTNFADAEAAMQTASNATGSAMAENEKYLDSINGKVAQFKASFEDLSNTIISSDFLKIIVDTGSGALNVLDGIVGMLGQMPSLVTAITGSMSFVKNKGIFETYKDYDGNKKIGTFWRAKNENRKNVKLDVISDIFALGEKDNGDFDKAFEKAQAKAESFGKDFSTAFEKGFSGVKTFDAVTDGLKNVNAELVKTTKSAGKLSGVKNFFSNALSSLKDFGKSLATGFLNMGISALVSFGVNKAIEGIVYAINRNSELQTNAQESGKTVDESLKSLDEYKTKILELKKSLESDNLSESQAYEARKQILSIQDELIANYGAEAEQLDMLAGSASDAAAAIESLGNSEMKKWLTDNNEAITNAFKYKNEKVNFNSDVGYLTDSTVDDLRKIIEDNGATLYQLPGSKSQNGKDSNYKVLLENVNRETVDETISAILSDVETYKSKVKYNPAKTKQIDEFIQKLTGSKDYYIDENYYKQIDNANKAALYKAKTDYSDIYKSIEDEQKNFNDAIASGNISSLNDTAKRIEEIRSAISGQTFSDESAKAAQRLMLDQIDELAKEVSKEEIILSFKTDNSYAQKVKSDFQELSKETADMFSDEGFDITLIDDQSVKDQFEAISQYAEDAGLSVSEFVQTLQMAGFWAGEFASQAFNFDNAKSNATTLLEQLESVQSILNNQSSGKSISTSDFFSEDFENYRSALEDVNGTMQVNEEKVKALAKAKANEAIATNDATKAQLQTTYLKNADEISRLTQKIKENTFEDGENASTILQQIDALDSSNRSIIDQCDQLDYLNKSLREATGTYQAWLDAQNGSDYGDMFSDSLNAIQAIKDVVNPESDDYNKIGTKKYKAAVDFIVPDTVDKENATAVQNYINSISDLFTYDEDGKRDGLDLTAFLNKAVEKGLMENDGGNYQIVGEMTMEKFAKGMQMSLPMVQAVFDELTAYGGEFHWDYETVESLAFDAQDAVTQLEKVKGFSKLKISLDLSEFDSSEEKVSRLDDTIKKMQKFKSKLKVDSEEYQQANAVIEYCIAQKQELESPAVMSVDTTLVDGKIGALLSAMQEFVLAKQEAERTELVFGADSSEAKEAAKEVESATDKIKKAYKDLPQGVNLKLNFESDDKLLESISGITKETMNVTLGVDDTAITGYEAPEKTIEVDANTAEADKKLEHTNTLREKLKDKLVKVTANTANATIYLTMLLSLYNKLKDKTVNIDFKLGSGSNGDKSGDSSGSNTKGEVAKVSGTAHASGDWRTSTGQTALVGELGREIVVDTRTGKWHTVGDNGAEFAYIPAGSIVFNHLQTKSLLERGFVNDRGTALVGGTAFGKDTISGGININNNPASVYSGSSGSGSGDSGGAGSDSGKEDTVLKNFQEWFSKFFDWIEIRLERQTDRISRYISKADRALDAKKYDTSASNYISAINSTSTLMGYEKTAYQKYSKQAQDVLKKAVASGLITSVGAKNIEDKVKSGAMVISEYGERTQEVIKDYQEWYNKAIDASDAISELHGKLRDYIKTLKEVREAQRDAKIESIDNLTQIATEGFVNTSGGYEKLSAQQVAYSNQAIADKNTAYLTYVSAVRKDSNSVRNNANKLVSSELKKATGKENQKYRSALQKAKSSMDARKKIDSDTLTTINKNNPKLYARLYAYNASIESVIEANMEYAVAYAANKREAFQNIREKYNSKNEGIQNELDLYQTNADTKQITNATDATIANEFLSESAKKIDERVANRKAAVDDFTKRLTQRQTEIKGDSWKGNLYKKQSAKSQASIKKFIRSIKDKAKKGDELSPDDIQKLATYLSKGYISFAFYNACISYNEVLQSKKDAEDTYELEKLTAEQEKSTIGANKIENIKNQYANKKNDNSGQTSIIQSTQSLKSTRGVVLTVEDYTSLINQSRIDSANLDSEYAAIEEQMQQNLKDGLWKQTDQEYINTKQYLDEIKNSLIQNQIAQEEWNNAIAELPYESLERALSLLDAIASYNKSVSDLKSASGIDLSESDYLTQINDITKEIANKEESRAQAYKDYLTALASADSVYGGKTADEWLARYNNFGTEINNLKSNIESLKDTLRDDVYWRDFERAHDAAKRLSSVISGLSDLIDSSSYVDKDTGLFTAFGVSQIANYVKNLETARTEVQNYSNDIDNLNKLYNRGYYTEIEYNEKLGELRDGLLDSAASMKSYIGEIMDIYKERDKAELDMLYDLIDARNEALQKKKDYYDYDKTIRDKTKDVQTLQAQIAALEGVETAEARAKKAKLEADLATKQEALQDTVNTHIFQLSKDMLSEMKTVLQDAFDDKWDSLWNNLSDIKSLLDNANALTSENAAMITNTISNLLGFYEINKNSTSVDISYASGTKYVPKNLTALTNEDGDEIIITKRGMITPLRKGDGVVPADLTDRIYDLAMNGLPETQLKIPTDYLRNLDTEKSGNMQIVNRYDNLINIEGSADAATVEDLKKFSKDFLKQSYEYTSQKMYEGYIKAGGKRRV